MKKTGLENNSPRRQGRGGVDWFRWPRINKVCKANRKNKNSELEAIYNKTYDS